jgi:hypothetical protein
VEHFKPRPGSRRRQALAHYHRRSNVETVFAMMKARYPPEDFVDEETIIE